MGILRKTKQKIKGALVTDEQIELGKESFVLQLIASAETTQTLYNLHCKAYLLMENVPQLKDLNWIPGKDGPHSTKMDEILKNPQFLSGYWEIIPRQEERMSLVKLTRKGKAEYEGAEYKGHTAETMQMLFRKIHYWYAPMPHDIFVEEMHTKFPNMCKE